MVWIVIAVVILGISAYFGNEYRLDRKAHKLNSEPKRTGGLPRRCRTSPARSTKASTCTGDAHKEVKV